MMNSLLKVEKRTAALAIVDQQDRFMQCSSVAWWSLLKEKNDKTKRVWVKEYSSEYFLY